MMLYLQQQNVPSLKLSICNLQLEEVDHFNFLGLIIDEIMKWHTHGQKVANKIRKVKYSFAIKVNIVFVNEFLILATQTKCTFTLTYSRIYYYYLILKILNKVVVVRQRLHCSL